MEPLATVSSMLLSLLILGFVFALAATLFGGSSLLGWGRSAYICATSRNTGEEISPSSWLQLHAGVSANPSTVQLCTGKPTSGQRWWYSLGQLPGTLTLVTVVLLTYLVLRQAERFGLYSSGMATRLRVLGWFLVAESVLGPTIKVYANRKLWITMASSTSSEIQWNPEGTALFVGLALLSLARIMRVGTAMREDLEGVV